jgi:hypothetical protein
MEAVATKEVLLVALVSLKLSFGIFLRRPAAAKVLERAVKPCA